MRQLYTDNHVVLVDTGGGKLADTCGKLTANLEAEQVSPEDIDTVVITHCHPDHLGGCLDADGNPAFRNARYIISQDDWDFWTSDAAEKAKDFSHKELILGFNRSILPGLESVVRGAAGGQEIVPGVRAVSSPGHTPGNISLVVESEGKQLLHASDAWLHPVHLRRPEWPVATAIDANKAVASRKALLEMAVDRDILVFATHMPFPGLGYVERDTTGYRWKAYA